MYREWSIIGGPLDLTAEDVGQQRTFKVTVNGGQPHDLVMTTRHVGAMFGGAIRSVSGDIVYHNHPVEVIGTYNTRDHTGFIHTNFSGA